MALPSIWQQPVSFTRPFMNVDFHASNNQNTNSLHIRDTNSANQENSQQREQIMVDEAKMPLQSCDTHMLDPTLYDWQQTDKPFGGSNAQSESDESRQSSHIYGNPCSDEVSADMRLVRTLPAP